MKYIHCDYYVCIFNIFFQNTTHNDISNLDEKTVGNARYFRRIQLMLRVLISICGQAVRDRFTSQQLLVKVRFHNKCLEFR